jgi:simple sugar transport system substrate-binding protein/ribose transport system substrate-binding protein
MALGVVALLAGCTPPKPAVQKQDGARKRRLAGIVFQEDQFFRLVLFGMRAAAKEAGVELLEGNSYNKPEKEIELVNTYIAQGVDAILISPLSKTGSVAALKPAKEKGIVVIAHNTPLAGDIHSAYIESSAFDLGVQTGNAARKYITEKLGGKATMAIIAFRSLIPEQSNERTNGFKSRIADLPGVKIVAEQDAWLPEQAVKRVSDILTAHPDINVIWSANEGGTIGSVMAVRNAGKAGKVAVFGTDSSEQLLGFLKSPENILQAVTSQRPVEVGRLAVKDALDVLDGKPVEKHVSMKGILLSREDPKGLDDFEKKLKEWIGRP